MSFPRSIATISSSALCEISKLRTATAGGLLLASLVSSAEAPSREQQSMLLKSKRKKSFNNMSTPDSSDSSKSSNNMASFKLLLLIMMVLQNSSTVLVGRYTLSSVPEDDQYEVNHLLLVTELGKLLLSCIFEFHTTGGKLLPSLRTHVFERPLDALKILVPALLYLLQNTLLYVALGNLTAPIFQVTYQAKLVTTALVSVVMLQRSYSFQQWVCLVGLSLGVAVVVLGEKKDGKTKSIEQNLSVGLTAVTVACLSSALAGVYFEKVLKKPNDSPKGSPPPASLWMRNIQLAFFSVIIAAYQGGLTNSSGKPYLHGFTFWPWVLVTLQAGGGLLVAAVINYADNVLKGLATGVSVVVATAFSFLVFGTPLTGQFSVGAAMILASVYFFSNPVALAKKEKDTEMKELLPK